MSDGYESEIERAVAPAAPPSGGPAFPVVDHMGDGWPGMMLRDWFAGQALGALHGQVADIFVQALVPPSEQSDGETRAYFRKRIDCLTIVAVAIADALVARLAERRAGE